mmetsp:Transcript_61168/g.162537  ORF Transcript_61168/g.162537 Transcript_61168/m.162537 type:complete len:192 (-) Transcript_61168:180-755(-)
MLRETSCATDEPAQSPGPSFVEVRVAMLSGEKVSVTIEPQCATAVLQKMLEDRTGVNANEQLLLIGTSVFLPHDSDDSTETIQQALERCQILHGESLNVEEQVVHCTLVAMRAHTFPDDLHCDRRFVCHHCGCCTFSLRHLGAWCCHDRPMGVKLGGSRACGFGRVECSCEYCGVGRCCAGLVTCIGPGGV